MFNFSLFVINPSAIFGGLVVLLTMHILLYLFYRENKYNLYYSLSILLMLIKLSPLFISDNRLLEIIDVLDKTLIPIINIACILFMYHLFKKQLNTKVLKTYIIVGFVFSICIFLNFKLQLLSYKYFAVPYTITSTILSISILVLAFKSKQRMVYPFSAILAIWLLFVMKRILFSTAKFIAVEIDVIQYFIFSFYYSMAIITTYKFAKQLRINVRLSESLTTINENLESEVKKQVEEIVESKEETFKVKTEKIKSQIDSLEATLILKKNLTKGFKDKLLGLKEVEDKDLKKELKKIVQDLITLEKSETKLHIKQSNLEKVGHSFYQKLDTDFKNLSNREREMCVYLKIGLSNTEIASLFNTSVNTIHVTRSRLRTKLNLKREDNLEKFIQAL